jgi:large subunit ribosomal protein L10
MSKKVKNLITRDIGNRLKDIEAVAVINPRGIPASKNNAIRRKLREKGLRMTVVKNTLAKRAVGDDSKLKGFDSLLDGPSAVIYGEASISTIARMILDEKKADEKIELRGIFFDGEVYTGDKGVEQVSKLPTREEAIGQVVALIVAPGQRLGGIFKGQAGKVAALIKAVEERAEKGGGGAAPEAAPTAPAPDAPAAPAAAAPEPPPAPTA